jgi:hypothetical protein
MKLSELRPCDSCGEGLLQSKDGTKYAVFYLVRSDPATLQPDATNRVMALAKYFGGNLGLAEAMGPDADGAVAVMSEVVPESKNDGFMVCQRCFMTVPIGVIVETVSQRRERASRENGDQING